jgi:hypothetical protein
MSQENYYRRLAAIEWSHVSRKAATEELLDKIRFHRKTLVPFEEVRKGLKLRHPSYKGIHEIHLDQIVGSVGRYNDFTRTFLPRSKSIGERWQRVSAAMSSLGTPPIELYKVGDAYFVSDGNHRVSVARAHGATTIEAEIWEFETPVRLRDDVTLDEVLLEAQRLAFLERTNLDQLRPDHEIRFTVPGRYIEIEYQIELYQKVLEKIDGEPCPYDKAVVDWYDLVFEPTVAIIRRESILDYFPGRTAADLFAWISRHRRHLSARYDLPVTVKDVARRVRGRGPLAWLRRLLAKTEV